MTEQELNDARRAHWRLDGRPVRTAEDAAEFLESVGMCALFPPPDLLLPSLVGAWAGSDERLPTAQRAFQDERGQAARELAVQLLRSRSAYESNLLGENVLLVTPSVFPFFYALKGDKNPRAELKPGRREKISPLAADAFAAIQKDGPMSKRGLRQALGGEPSEAALDRALGELWSRLRITRVDYRAGEGALWDTLLRWAPEAVREGLQLSVGEALSALISRYLEAVVAAERKQIEEFFSLLAPRSRVRENVNALLAARELAFRSVGSKTLVELAPLREAGQAGSGGGETMSRAKRLIIAIDGPAGVGKSTVASRVARKLGYVNIESGAMYRALALKAIQNDVSFDDGPALAKLARQSRIELEPVQDGNRVLLDGEDVSRRVREADVSEASSRVSVHPQVREWMVARQREMGQGGGVVMEGRDIGTKVFPDADLKIFLEAEPAVRSERRLKQHAVREKARGAVAEELKERDRRDRTRQASPLEPAADAVVLDTTHLGLDEVLKRVFRLIEERR